MVAALKRRTSWLALENTVIAARVAQSWGNDIFDLHGTQVLLWLDLADCETRLRRLKHRRKRRNRLWKTIRRAVPGETRKAHLDALQWQQEVLQDRISIIKQIGDAFVWNLAIGDPRFVQSLFRKSTHQLPSYPAIDAYFRILEAAEQSSRYQAVLTDLTRCCGVGDVLIRGATWPHPTPFEVKVRTQPDGSLLTALYGNSITFQLDPEDFKHFTEAFGMRAPEPVSFDDRGERQKGEVDAETSRTFKQFRSAVRHAAPVVRRNWRSLEGVIERAAAGICSCDLAETGLAYVTVPFRRIDPARIREMIWEVLRHADVDAGEEDWDLWSSYELLYEEALSAKALPYLLWRVNARCRALLMTGDVLLVSVARKRIWREAFQRAGIGWEEVDDIWRLTGFGNELTFDAADVERLRTGLAYSGISPKAVAEHAAMNLRNPDGFTVQRYRRSADEPMA